MYSVEGSRLSVYFVDHQDQRSTRPAVANNIFEYITMSNTLSPKASPAVSPTVTPAELGSFLDAVASAPVALRDVPRMNHILARLVGLANSKHTIGEIPDMDEMVGMVETYRGLAAPKAGGTD